jgi:hypothetical protein
MQNPDRESSIPDHRKLFLVEKKPILCRFGIHRWSEAHIGEVINKSVDGWEKRCLRCDEVKCW